MSQLTTQKTPSLKALISSESMKEQFAAALPKHLSPDRFARVAITALTRTPKLQECTQVSFMKCLLDLSSMGIEPDGRRAHLIPYGKECTLILDYKGIVELMRRSGDVTAIHADTVCANDVFKHNLGIIEEHTYDLKQPRGEMYAAYCQVTLKDGSKQSAIMSKEEIDGIRNRSKAGKSGPWVTDYREMSKKTAVRRVSKMITLSPEIMDHIQNDGDQLDMRAANEPPQKAMESNPFDSSPVVDISEGDEETPPEEEKNFIPAKISSVDKVGSKYDVTLTWESGGEETFRVGSMLGKKAESSVEKDVKVFMKDGELKEIEA